MAALTGISSRLGWFGIAKQTAKGSAVSAPTEKLFFAGAPSLKPYITSGRFSMTDGSRDQGDPFVSMIGVQGDVPLYCHPQAMALLFHGALGGISNTGATNYTHTITPANALPYFTCFRMVGGVIFEQFVDCQINQLVLEGTAGNPLTVTLSIIGLSSTFLNSGDPGTNPDTEAPYLYMEAAAALKTDTVAYPIHAVSFTINNNLTAFQADTYAADNIDPGGREISGQYSVRMPSATGLPVDYRNYFYGSDGGTAQTTSISTHALDFLWTRNANESMEIAIPSARWADLDPEPDPGGDVLVVDCAFDVLRHYTTGVEDANCTVTVKDQVATP